MFFFLLTLSDGELNLLSHLIGGGRLLFLLFLLIIYDGEVVLFLFFYLSFTFQYCI